MSSTGTFERFCQGAGHGHDVAGLAEQPRHNVGRHGVVFDEQDPQAEEVVGLSLGGVGAGRDGVVAVAPGREGGGGDGDEFEPEAGPMTPPLAVSGEGAAVGLDHRPADRQAQPQAAERAGGGGPPLLEGVEDPGEDLGLDPDAGVGDLDDQKRPLAPTRVVTAGSSRPPG